MHRYMGLPAVFVVCVVGQGLLQQEYRSHGDSVVKDYDSINIKHRSRREISLAVKGLYALKSLIADATPVSSNSKKFRKYLKMGDVQTAIRDYYSVKPKQSLLMDIRLTSNSNTGKVLSGTVGDRWVVLWMEGAKYSKGRPTLEVIDTKPTTGRYIDRIIYTNTQN